ncbi:hypothetical protein [Polaromonas sp. YR568]|uniref:hypothetical protein n=1 Tax=Polaromonas sp. YR568 TaxID=1855301 RepID=UPI00398BCFC9
MGRWVALSAAADPQAAWTKSPAEQRFFNSTGLGMTVAFLLAYALSGAVFGYLPVFVLEGFAMLQGTAAWVGSAGTIALALGWATHLVQRHWSGASPATCTTFRYICYIAVATCVCLVALAELAGGPLSRLRWNGLSPASEWLFAPLPWVWRELAPLGSDKVTGKLFFAGGAALALAFFFLKAVERPRVFIFFLGAAACIAGFYFLGDAALDYSAARGLPGASADYARELKTNPGRYNAWNFLSWLGALACLAYGVLMISMSLVIQTADARAMVVRS